MNHDRNSAVARYPQLGQLIAGKFDSSEREQTFEVIDPSTGDVLGSAPVATHADIEQALAAADRAFPAWKRTSAFDRARILRKVAETIRSRVHELSALVVLEQGKTWAEALGEVEQAAGMWEWYAEEGRRAYGRVIPSRDVNTRHLALVEPIGPIAAFHAWNGPFVNPSRKLAGALAAGCTIVLKAAEEVPACALAIGRIACECGLPGGTVSVLVGDPAMISQALIDSPVTRALTFTGSIQIGRMLALRALGLMKRSILELGGHAPVLVFEDVDIESVAKSAVETKFRNAGQICTSPTRFYVQRSIYSDFVDAFAAEAKRLVVGCGFDPKTNMGPVIHLRRLNAVSELVKDAKERGVSVVSGGNRIDRPGFFFEPTVLANVNAEAKVSNQEPFGPIAALTPFDTYDEAIQLANRLPFGLASYVHTNDVHTMNQAINDVEAGNVIGNAWRASLPETPFGGVKESGIFSEGGVEGLLAFQNVKHASLA